MILQELSQSKNVSAALGGVWGSSTEAPELSIQFFGAKDAKDIQELHAMTCFQIFLDLQVVE